MLCKSLVLCIAFSFMVFSWASVQFAKRGLRIGNQNLLVEVADTDEKRTQGLMHRQSLPANQGMLFVFEKPQILGFWMKNTHIPLSIGFFNKDRVLTQIIDKMKPTSMMQKDLPQYLSREPSLFALEVNQGWFKKHGVKTGQVFQMLPRKTKKNSTKVE